MNDSIEAIEANKIEVGDILVNLGIVDAVAHNGVFVVCAVRGTVWSIASGKGDINKWDVVFFGTEPVVIVSDPTYTTTTEANR